ncbi:MAG: hypothetical protein ACRELC_12755 [Gemmatimonadota bacterium]
MWGRLLVKGLLVKELLVKGLLVKASAPDHLGARDHSPGARSST